MTPKVALLALMMIQHRLPEGAPDATFRAWATSHLSKMVEWAADPAAPDYEAGHLLRAVQVGVEVGERGTVEIRLRRLMGEILEVLGVTPAPDTSGALALWGYFLWRADREPDQQAMNGLLRKEIKALSNKMKLKNG